MKQSTNSKPTPLTRLASLLKVALPCLAAGMLTATSADAQDNFAASSLDWGTGHAGSTIVLTNTLQLGTGNPQFSALDVQFVFDTTGSMGTLLNNAKSQATTLMNSLSQTFGSNSQFGVIGYKDKPRMTSFSLEEYDVLFNDLGSTSIAQGHIDSLNRKGGGDWPEDGLTAVQAAIVETSWRPNSARAVVWFGDAPSHEGGISNRRVGYTTNRSERLWTTREDVIDAAAGASVQVHAFDMFGSLTDRYGGLNGTKQDLVTTISGAIAGQATDIATATGGTYNTGSQSLDLVASISNALSTSFASISEVGLSFSGLPTGVAIRDIAPLEGSWTRGTNNSFDFVMTLDVSPDAVLGSFDFTGTGLVNNMGVASFSNSLVIDSVPVVEGAYWAVDSNGGGTGTWDSSSSVFAANSGTNGSLVRAVGARVIFGDTPGTVTVSNGVILSNGMGFYSDGYVITGSTVALDGTDSEANTLVTDSNVAASINTVLSGSAGFTKAGAGTLILSGTNNYSGATRVLAGVLKGSTASLNTADGIVNNGVVVLDQASAPGTISGVIEGSGSLIKTGSKLLALTGRNVYSGGTLVEEGTLRGTTTALQGDITNNGTVIFQQGWYGTYTGDLSGAGLLQKNGAGTVYLAGSNSHTGGTLINAGRIVGNTESLPGVITNNSELHFKQDNNGTYNSVISGTGTLYKYGGGSLTITDSNTYTGSTLVQQGTLVVDGSLSSETAVQGGATLGGSGSVGGLIINEGGTLSPGNSPGTITVTGNATWNPGGNYNWQIYNATGTAGAPNGWDLTDISGTLDLSALSLGNTFNINLWSLSGISPDADGAAINFAASLNASQEGSWVIATAAGGITGFTGSEQFSTYTSPNNGTAGFANAITGGFFVTSDGTSLYLNYAVPEPGTYAAAALLTALGGYVRWRRRRKS